MNTNAIYNLLLTRLQTKVPDIAYIDWYNQQTLTIEEGENLPFNLPAVFIEFTPANTSTSGRLTQLEEINFRLYLICESFEETSSLEDETTRNRALSEHVLSQEVISALLGYSSEYFGSISQADSTTDHDFTSIKGLMLTFKAWTRNKESKPPSVSHEAAVKVIQGRCN